MVAHVYFTELTVSLVLFIILGLTMINKNLWVNCMIYGILFVIFKINLCNFAKYQVFISNIQ